jgi:ferritin-like metal-binding protein YciE
MSIDSHSAGSSRGETASREKKASQHYKLFEEGLKDVYYSEKTQAKNTENNKKASPEKLIHALENILRETEGQLTRLRQVFEVMDKGAESGKYKAIAGMLKEAEDIIAEPLP